MAFVFYDLETTGTSPEFDQPLQFAAIRTDENFAEIERVNIRCRLAPHILPSPQAMVVTGVTPEQLADPSLPALPEFAKRIADLIEGWAPSIWAGYNSIHFDENHLRQTFYQNLLPDVYATQFNGNTRFDVMHAVYAAYLREPGVLSWPDNGAGQPVFKLELLAPENGFNEHNAHDALGDVEATVHIARRIAEGSPKLWAELLDNAYKQNVQAKLESFRPLELVLRFGGEPTAFTGCFCGYSAENPAEGGFFDLDAEDPEKLLAASQEELLAAVTEAPRVIRTVAANKAPPLLEAKDPGEERLRRASVIAASAEFRRKVGEALAARFAKDPDAPPRPVEKQIYDGFYSREDKNLLREFHGSDWPRRQEIIERLSDSRLKQLGRRLIAFHSPALLSDQEKARFRDYLDRKWNAPNPSEVEWMTFEKAEEQIAELRAREAIDSAKHDEIIAFMKGLGTQLRS